MSIKKNPIRWLEFMRYVAEEEGYKVEDYGNSFEAYLVAHHATSFKFMLNSSGYVQVHTWEENAKEAGYGRAVYSLRNHSEVAEFCNVLMASSRLRAGRH